MRSKSHRTPEPYIYPKNPCEKLGLGIGGYALKFWVSVLGFGVCVCVRVCLSVGRSVCLSTCPSERARGCVCVCHPCNQGLSNNAGGMAVLFPAMPTKLWNMSGRETGRSFLYLQRVAHGSLSGSLGTQLKSCRSCTCRFCDQ